MVCTNELDDRVMKIPLRLEKMRDDKAEEFEENYCAGNDKSWREGRIGRGFQNPAHDGYKAGFDICASELLQQIKELIRTIEILLARPELNKKVKESYTEALKVYKDSL
mgnify:CR=1 FL=1